MSDPPESNAADKARWISDAVATYQGRLITYSARLTGDEHRARDIVQDAFIKLWQADEAAVNGHLGAWLYRVCRNRALDVMRKESRMTALDTDAPPAAPAAPASPDQAMTRAGGHHADADAPATPDAVMKMLGELPPRQQEVLRLKFQGELSYREIADVMDLSVSNVGFIIHTAIKALRDKLTGAAESGTAAGAATNRVAG